MAETEEKKIPSEKEIREALALLGFAGEGTVTLKAFTSEENGAEYAVWLVSRGNDRYVLKKAKGYEREVYGCFFREKKQYVPQLLGECSPGGDDYILLEYCEGEDLRVCDRQRLVKALDALCMMQDEYWQRDDLYDKAVTMDKALEAITDRGRWLGSELLEKAYADFTEGYKRTPRSLCHDDLLPINVLVGERAVLIDWEYGGVLPYLSSFARLIAHGRDDRNCYFYLSEEDRAFAVDCFYHMLPEKHGIAYEQYRTDLDHFLFYEYCEWVMLGNRYEEGRDDERFGYYVKLAEEAARRIIGESPEEIKIDS